MIRLGALALVALAGTPLTFTQPTSIELEPSGNVLVVENNPGRVLRVDPVSGRVTVLARSLVGPYSIVRAPSGAVFVSVGKTIRRLGGGVVARSSTAIGPLATARDGTLYYATDAGVFRVGVGRLGSRVRIRSPHGLAVMRGGAVLVSDTGGNRIVRIARDGTASTFAADQQPSWDRRRVRWHRLRHRSHRSTDRAPRRRRQVARLPRPGATGRSVRRAGLAQRIAARARSRTGRRRAGDRPASAREHARPPLTSRRKRRGKPWEHGALPSDGARFRPEAQG